ncbi:dihydrodipicolinate synthase family protein [Clostridium swellfunianum]|uniref:dihydrodipicolinate synthase family protein n=1 Tax=Clostridium swellfunianum TaxID=1367462 RepID=UPI00202E2F6A|nr:dihydrodipicolinate synthase family protein [Clostridium swellfunianum]MCM0650902.1 dihydrodipicolinate synthase family protein [Clostridium swellfunianum]
MKEILKGIFPAVPIPFKKNGELDEKAQESYIEYMKTQEVSGFAVWVHTGRGLLITEEQREYVLKSWREAFPDKLIIAGVGANIAECLKCDNPEDEYIKRSLEMAIKAKELKADAVLVYAPNIFKGNEDLNSKIVSYHKEIAKVGLPVILFYLYEEAGGISYSRNVLRELLSIEEVIGIKMATLDSVMSYQDTAEFIKKEFPQKMLITGEDRMFGYTLMRGAQGALVGLGAACGTLQKRMMDAYYNKDFKLFVELSEKVDKLAECTFVKPMEGYIKRMLTVLNLLGVIPKESTYDLFGPIEELDTEEVKKIESVLKEIGEL